MFTKKHYKAVAKLFAFYRPVMVESQWIMMREAFAQLFRMDNPRFDAIKFVDACNTEATLEAMRISQEVAANYAKDDYPEQVHG